MKNQLSHVRTIIFDYDGTLHDSSKIYIPAFKRAYDYLVKNNKAEEKNWSDEEITQWLGYSKQEMWELFMPDLDPDFRQDASGLIGKTMLEMIQRNEARWYAGAVDTLEYLKDQGYTLLFLSNCSISYMDMHAERFGLNDYFSRLYCTEQFNFRKSKKDIVKLLKQDFEGEIVVIGDRFQDIETSELENVYAIGCTYGFGKREELEGADLLISDIGELRNYL